MKKILVVDDSEIERDILVQLLADRYETDFAENGVEAVSKSVQFSPDLVLMDIQMPEMNGFDACKAMRAEGFDSRIIFLSRLDSTRDKLKAYEAGGDDFIGKPYHAKEMLAKIALNLIHQDQVFEAIKSSKEVSEVAHRSLTDLSHLGRIVNFLQKTQQCMSFDELASMTFSLLKNLNLKSSLLIHSIDFDRLYFDDDMEKPIERELFQALKGQRRILEFSEHRAAFNWKRASLLIKNMPEEATENGAMKDYLAYIMEGIESAVQSKLMQLQLNEAIKRYKERDNKLKLSILSAIEDIEESLVKLFTRADVAESLPLDIEELILGYVQAGRKKADQHLSQGFNMESELDKVMEMLTQSKEDTSDEGDDAVELF